MTATFPRVSVCIPLFNGAATIAELLESVRIQSFAHFRAIIADDASNDEGVQIVKPFLDDPRFQLIRRPRNLGFSENLAQLIDAEQECEFLVFPGQDDVWCPDFLQVHIDSLDAHPSVGVVHSRCQYIDAKGALLHQENWYWARLRPVMGGADLIESLMTHNYVCLPAAMVRRRALDEVNAEMHDRRFNYVPDWWMWLLLAAKGWSFGYLEMPDCSYRLHSAQLTQTLAASLKTAEMSRVPAELTALLDGHKFGSELSEQRRAALKHLAHARLLRRGLAMMMKAESRNEGYELAKETLKRDLFSFFAFPFYFGRYLIARLTQRRDCAGMPELFHPLGAR